MKNGTLSIHPICNGRTIYTKAKLMKMQKESESVILYPIVMNEMIVVRNNVEQILRERQIMGAYCASAIGISKSHWSYWMADPKRNLSVEALLALSDLLGCSFHELIMGEKGSIKLPKKCSLLYQVIKSRAGLHAICDKILNETPVTKIDTKKLIYLRLRERANDLNRPLRNYLIETSLEFVSTAKEFSSKDPAFKSRIPAFFGFCGFFEDNADYLARQDFSDYEMLAGRHVVEDIYRKTIGKFASLTEEQQVSILGYLLYERYLRN